MRQRYIFFKLALYGYPVYFFSFFGCKKSHYADIQHDAFAASSKNRAQLSLYMLLILLFTQKLSRKVGGYTGSISIGDPGKSIDQQHK
jgi:hypothetical protein